MKKLFLILPITISSLILSSPVYAHPHVFIDYKVTVIFSKNVFQGIKMDWNMDDMTSTSFLEEFDTNKNGKLDPKELIALKGTTLASLKSFNYFTHINIDNKKVYFSKINNFNITYNDNLLKYSFNVDLNIKAADKPKNVEINLNDSTNYVAFNPIDKKVEYKKSEKIVFFNKEPKSIEDQKVLFQFTEKK